MIGRPALALLFAVSLAGCRRDAAPDDAPESDLASAAELHQATEQFVESLPSLDVGPEATTRPALVGETLFAVDAPRGTADYFAYEFLRRDDGKLVIRRSGGFAGVSQFLGPVERDERVNDLRRAAAALKIHEGSEK